jgi:murein DD-endopeptidase MepM/ murein hydrolase activator NlpD
MRRGDFTVIVSRLSGVPARKFSIPRGLLLVSIIVVSVLICSVTLSGLHYFHMWGKSQDYDNLKSEVTQLRKQNESFRLTAKQLTDRLSFVEISAQKLRLLSGLDEGLGGLGGPSSGNDAVLDLDEKSLFNHFKSLDRRSTNLQMELLKLQEYYKDRGILLAATPSVMPVHGYPNDRFGYRKDPFNGKRDFHPGVDISAPVGNKVVATADGIVRLAGRQVGYGKIVTVQHKFGISTRYGHLKRIAVGRNQEVKKGDVIGYVGSTGRTTGPHVHYEVRLNGRPLDPSRFFRESR